MLTGILVMMLVGIVVIGAIVALFGMLSYLERALEE